MNAMIIGLENKMDNMKTKIMNIVSKQIDSLKFQQKLVEEQEKLSIYCQKCRKNIFYVTFLQMLKVLIGV